MRTAIALALLSVLLAPSIADDSNSANNDGRVVSKSAVTANAKTNDDVVDARCFAIRTNLTVYVPYTIAEGSKNVTKHGKLTMPKVYENATTCGSQFDTVTYSFFDGGVKVTLTFNQTSDEYGLSGVEAKYNTSMISDTGMLEKAFPGYNFTEYGALSNDVSNTSLLDVARVQSETNHTYACMRGNIDLGIADDVHVELSEFKVVVFDGERPATEKLTWPSGNMCDADVAQSDIVPILVGAALVVLLIVVLVGYLVGRARVARSGYSSV